MNDEVGIYAAERRHQNKPVRTRSVLGDIFAQSLAIESVIPAKAGIQPDDLHIQLPPTRIISLNQLKLPGSLPSLDRLLAGDWGDFTIILGSPRLRVCE